MVLIELKKVGMKVIRTKRNSVIKCILQCRCNVFLLSANGRNILIDTSSGREWPKLKKRLNSLKIEKIDLLILTHTHYDHAANAAVIKREFGANVIVNMREVSYLEKGENPMPNGTNFMTRFMVNTLGRQYLAKVKYEPCLPDIIVDQTLDLKEYGVDAYILHTPGHSPGSQSVIVDDEIAVVGDAMFGVFPGSVFPPYAENVNDLTLSWGKLLETGCRLFLPSHGTPDTSDLLKREYEKRVKV
jgi:hydroxyacylglutathione hydrolase